VLKAEGNWIFGKDSFSTGGGEDADNQDKLEGIKASRQAVID
jgi:hypothetical protein